MNRKPKTNLYEVSNSAKVYKDITVEIKKCQTKEILVEKVDDFLITNTDNSVPVPKEVCSGPKCSLYRGL